MNPMRTLAPVITDVALLEMIFDLDAPNCESQTHGGDPDPVQCSYDVAYRLQSGCDGAAINVCTNMGEASLEWISDIGEYSCFKCDNPLEDCWKVWPI